MDAARSHSELESILASAWFSLAGGACAFRSLDGMPELDPEAACFQLPVLGADGLEAGRVLLALSDEDAQQLGASMFGLPQDELGQEELDDAHAELCNIFGSCLVKALDDRLQLELGLPRRAGLWDFEARCRRGVPRLTLAATLGVRHIVVVYFDSAGDADGTSPALPTAKDQRHG
ncbi:hypothetical protein H5407_14705 [Mitsuaria sp. WAJ17]|uniref:hypothetical protein n=1 Tax=Mitsuaria sp. WAJ17 TaxID=2761452 RepID=UPI0015FFDBCC|nr:hypothetical protein [Mitsuaria sp. WAJ17]MBB2486473.1 hypothetical protein [Mitsuaria sp. WAJ17]